MVDLELTSGVSPGHQLESGSQHLVNVATLHTGGEL